MALNIRNRNKATNENYDLFEPVIVIFQIFLEECNFICGVKLWQTISEVWLETKMFSQGNFSLD